MTLPRLPSFLATLFLPLVVGATPGCGGDKGSDDGTPTDTDTDTDADTDTDTDADTDSDADTDTDTDTDTGTSELTVSVAPSPHVDNVFWVTVTAPAGGSAWVEYGLDGTFDQQTDPTEVSTEHVIPLLGLKGGRQYAWRAVVEDASGGRTTSSDQTLDTASVPPLLADATQVQITPDATPGYTLLSTLDRQGSFVAIFDQDADPVWWQRMSDDDVVITALTGFDGASIAYSAFDQTHKDDVGRFVRVAIDGSEAWETRLLLGHHAAFQHDDGTVGFIAYDFRETTTFMGPTVRMAADRIYEVPEGATDADVPVELFNSFDDMPEPALTCTHMQSSIDRFDETDLWEWTHGNSLAYVPSEDAYYYNTKFTDWMLKIDRSTGEVLWQMGGFGGDFTAPNGSSLWTSPSNAVLWSHSHMSQVWEGGMMVFDNGDHRTQTISSIAEIQWDEATMSAMRVWEWPHPDLDYSYAIGDARKLANGHYLAAWGQLGTVHEVSPAGDVVWEMQLPAGVSVGRVRHLDALDAF